MFVGPACHHPNVVRLPHLYLNLARHKLTKSVWHSSPLHVHGQLPLLSAAASPFYDTEVAAYIAVWQVNKIGYFASTN